MISVREEPYVEAARALGAPRRTIISRYVLQNVIQSVPALATLNAADAILTLAALGFLGYGIQPTDAAEWGYDLQRAIDDAGAGIWWTGLFPGLAIVLLVTGFTLFGEGLNDVHQPADPRAPDAKPEPEERPCREGEAAPGWTAARLSRGRERPDDSDGASRSSTSATSGSGTAPRATRCAPSTASRFVDRRRRDARTGRRVGLRQVDPRPRRARPAARGRRDRRRGALSAAASWSGCRRRRCASCAGPSSG